MSLNKRLFPKVDSAVDPTEHFDTVTYTGNNSSKSITGLGFQPDLVWVKNRTNANSHNLIDSLRGATKTLFSNATNAESTQSSVTSFDSDGFSLGNYVGVNGNYNYVAWCFKAGGAPSGSDKVSIDSTSYATMSAAGLSDGTEPIDKLSVNTKLGFSIVKYTAPALIADTVAHGLGESPEMIILKSTSVARNWNVFHKDVGLSKNLHLNTTDSANTGEYWTANSSTFSIQDYSSSANWIAYCFTSKTGVSKVGTYTGTGASGNNVYTGFEPAFVMLKLYSTTSSSGHWVIFDNARGAEPPMLRANTTDAEFAGDRIDFNADGFTLKDADAGRNYSGFNYIYLAFAAN